jgi:hypothetical protein
VRTHEGGRFLVRAIMDLAPWPAGLAEPRLRPLAIAPNGPGAGRIIPVWRIASLPACQAKPLGRLVLSRPGAFQTPPPKAPQQAFYLEKVGGYPYLEQVRIS